MRMRSMASGEGAAAQPVSSLKVAQTTPLWCQKRRARKIKKCHHWWEWPTMSTRPGKNLQETEAVSAVFIRGDMILALDPDPDSGVRFSAMW